MAGAQADTPDTRVGLGCLGSQGSRGSLGRWGMREQGVDTMAVHVEEDSQASDAGAVGTAVDTVDDSVELWPWVEGCCVVHSLVGLGSLDKKALVAADNSAGLRAHAAAVGMPDGLPEVVVELLVEVAAVVVGTAVDTDLAAVPGAVVEDVRVDDEEEDIGDARTVAEGVVHEVQGGIL